MSDTEDRKVGLRLDLEAMSHAPVQAEAPRPAGRGLAKTRRPTGSVVTRARNGALSGAAAVVNLVFGGLIRTFVLFVAIPTIAAGLYLGVLASKQYMAESQFVVRGNVEKPQGSGAGNPLAGMMGGLSGSSQDSYVVSDHIQSSDMVERLQASLGVARMYEAADTDFWARFDPAGSKEDLLRYWRKMTRVSVENMSGIITLRVWAFTPQDALRISGEVIRESEDLANRITQRGRDDSMRFARSEVARAEERVARALLRIREVKDANGIINPEVQIKDQLALLTDLRKQKIDLELRLQSLGGSLKADSPVIRDLLSQKRALEAQIAEAENRLTTVNGAPAGAGGARSPVVASNALRAFEEVEIERQFAEKAYDAAQGALDFARQKANAQQIYVTVFAPPSLPENAFYPRPFGLTFVVFFTALGIWLIGTLGVAAVNDHRF